jgi:hypothetical protein
MKRGPKSIDVIERRSRHTAINPETGCYEFNSFLNREGYGQIGVEGNRLDSCHRAAYTRLVGPIPEGHQLNRECHTRDTSCQGGPACRHRRCWKPEHLTPVTALQNSQRGRSAEWQRARHAARTACKHGHPFDVVNTYISPDGRRGCRTCRRAAKRRYNLRRSGKVAS